VTQWHINPRVVQGEHEAHFLACRQTTQGDGATFFAVVHTLGYQVVTLRRTQIIMIRSQPARKHRKPCSGDHPAEKHRTLWPALNRVEKHINPNKYPPYGETHNTVMGWSPYSETQSAVIWLTLRKTTGHCDRLITQKTHTEEYDMVVILQRNTEHCNRLSYCRETQNTVTSWSRTRKQHCVLVTTLLVKRTLWPGGHPTHKHRTMGPVHHCTQKHRILLLRCNLADKYRLTPSTHKRYSYS